MNRKFKTFKFVNFKIDFLCNIAKVLTVTFEQINPTKQYKTSTAGMDIFSIKMNAEIYFMHYAFSN